MFVMHDPEHLVFVNAGRADWFESLEPPGWRVLDLGAGNGYFDLELGRRGYEVTAVDRVGSVIEAARRLRTDETVEFVVSDLRETSFGEASFDVITLFGVVGLMSVEDDTHLLRDCYRWLAPGGVILADSDTELAETETTEAEHEFGLIKWNWTSDPGTRTNMLTPELHRKDGVLVGLKDPVDAARGDHEGLHRCIYPKEELAKLLSRIGFEVTEVGHFVQYVFPDSDAGAYMLKATRP
jgi:ubiquinone/menaquinone biosynthesis C-methylase UbiE